MCDGEGSNLRLKNAGEHLGMRFEREFGLRKIFENFGTLALLGTYYIGIMGLRPVTIL